MNILQKIKKIWHDARFEVEIKDAIQRLKSSENMFAYPLIASLKFEQDWYRERFDNGIPVRKSVIEKSQEIGDGMKNSLKEISQQNNQG